MILTAEILFGDCNTEVYDVAELIYGFNLQNYKSKLAADWYREWPTNFEFCLRTASLQIIEKSEIA